jgi:hypothetical protein
LFAVEIESPGGISVYQPQISESNLIEMEIELFFGCPSGFYEKHADKVSKLCCKSDNNIIFSQFIKVFKIVPCPPGEFSPDGKTECDKCPTGFFQPTPGSGACIQCPQGYKTLGEGSIAEYECKLGVHKII